MKDLSELENWFRDFIISFREEAAKLPDNVRKRISNLEDFFSPCQILCIQYIGFPHQFILVTHDSKRPDQEIEIIKLHTWEAIDKIGSLVKDPRWDRILTDEEMTRVWRVSNYSEIIERYFIGVIKGMEGIIHIKPPEPGASSRMMFLGRDFTWLTNRLELTSFKALIDKIMEDANREIQEKEAERKKIKQQQPILEETGVKEEEEIKGYGTYFYPPIWVGEYQDYSFSEKVHGRSIWPEKVLDVKYYGNLLVVYNNGYIGIEETSRQNAHMKLNEIMAIGLLLGIPLFSVNNYELSEATFNPETLDFKTRGLRQRGALSRAFEPQDVFVEQSTRPYLSIEKRGIVKIVELAEKISQLENIANCLPLLIEANTCFQYSQYLQSFILAWTVIEKHLNFLWETILTEQQVSRNRIRKLTGSEWSISQVIDILSLEKSITDEEYNVLHDLRKKRNNLVHEGEIVEKRDAETCLLLAHGYVIDRTKIYDHISKNEFSRYILGVYDPEEF